MLATLAPFAPAGAQNLDAGKSAAQLFTEACSGCHRSPREVKGNSSASFLREHYTTGSEMAATMASYLAGFGGGEPRGPGAAQPKQRSAPATASRETPEVPRRPQQAEPKAEPKAASGGANREAAPATANRGRTGAAASEAKPPSPTPPAPTRPVLEDFEE